jgi:uncharacterized integral membrane protein
MRIKTIIIILITAVLTIALVQNTGPVYFSFLWATFRLSKLVMLLITAAIAFILGVLTGRPTRVKKLGDDLYDHHPENENSNTLSDEDRDYIS